MTARTLVAGLVVVLSLEARPLAQSATTELDVTVGQSSEAVRAAASQVRIFGDAVAGWQYYVEGAWAEVWGKRSDAFSGAYPYDKRIHPIELYGEKTIVSGPYIAGVRVGRYRTPFGIYGRGDHAYNGILRAPLIRYGGYWALSNNFLEGGASVLAGTPKLFAEATFARPQDVDVQGRRNGLDRVVRVQGSIGPFIVGASHIRTQPSIARTFATGSAVFSGVDVRWMSGGVQLRGEWIDGHPFAGARTFGGYVDAIVHRSVMGPVTAVFRAERLDYLARRSSYLRRYTAGTRIRLSSVLAGQINIVRQPRDVRLPAISALDVALTFTTRR